MQRLTALQLIVFVDFSTITRFGSRVLSFGISFSIVIDIDAFVTRIELLKKNDGWWSIKFSVNKNSQKRLKQIFFEFLISKKAVTSKVTSQNVLPTKLIILNNCHFRNGSLGKMGSRSLFFDFTHFRSDYFQENHFSKWNFIDVPYLAEPPSTEKDHIKLNIYQT